MDMEAPRKVPLSLRHLPPRWLRRKRSWLTWQYELHEGDTKPRKVPHYANGRVRAGKQGTPRDRNQLVTFEEAYEAAKAQGRDGVGIALLRGGGVCALDFDGCVLPDGSLPPEIARFGGYTYT